MTPSQMSQTGQPKRPTEAEFYEHFHGDARPLSRAITEDNFTYVHLTKVIRTHVQSGVRVLDIGCGLGALSLYTAALGARVLGVDISARAVSAARQSARHLGLEERAQFTAADFLAADLPGPFDLILCFEVLEHLPDDRGAIRRIAELLSPGGRALISVPSPNAPIHRRRVRRAGRDPFDEQFGHLRRYTQEQLSSLVAEAGLRVERVRLTEGWLRSWLFVTHSGRFLQRFVRGKLTRVVTWLDDRLVSPFGEAQVILVAQRPLESGTESARLGTAGPP